MQFTKATKQQAKLRMAIAGVAGSGKTYSALSIARHLGTRVAVIDTEHGSASKYANLFEFDVLELDSFHPQKYIDAIHAAESAGYDVLVIDSLSHAWAGKDGALELVDRAAKRSNSQNKFMAWGDVTPLQNQLIDSIIGARLHIIATMRSKTEYALQDYVDGSGKTKQKPVKMGLAPIQRYGVEYEFDVVGEMDMRNTMTIVKSRVVGLTGAEIEKPSNQLAETLNAWLSDGAPQLAPAPIPQTTLPPQPPIPSKQNGNGAMSKEKFFTYAKEQNAVSLAQEIANRHAKNPDWDKSFAELNDLLVARNAQQG